jgi:hypothetical protein
MCCFVLPPQSRVPVVAVPPSHVVPTHGIRHSMNDMGTYIRPSGHVLVVSWGSDAMLADKCGQVECVVGPGTIPTMLVALLFVAIGAHVHHECVLTAGAIWCEWCVAQAERTQ